MCLGNAKVKLPKLKQVKPFHGKKMPSNPVLGDFLYIFKRDSLVPNFDILNLFGSCLGCGFELWFFQFFNFLILCSDTLFSQTQEPRKNLVQKLGPVPCIHTLPNVKLCIDIKYYN